ncbi:alanine racemase [Leifsonia sp. LS1]|uniref:LacI family DNA-binding transcriptional regulator n=1 Tax=unclassified Leifsonia TaxID=2663824 RepID=UPI001CBFF907|nr:MULTISPECIES: LacI family DNA-binding transcriptional regulator [unclassified Leifsonia]UAJ79079.1 LacI family DNA-binding transcriptional regulator [Leifsonia sp. ZF2019]GIT78963.1 alanine racemase [Leifsonia sp. LS1]
MGSQPTVSDVADAAGVSRQTVSNVLNAPEVVRPATRERVQDAIVRLGYRPHASARRLRTQKSSTIGIRLDPITQDGISGSILDRFLHALTEQADRKGLRVLLFTADSPDDEIRQFRRLSDAADVDGFVLTSTFHGDPRTEWLIEHGQPFVTFGRPWGIDDMTDPEHLWVDVDGRSGLRDATAHLLQHGARRVGFLGWPDGSGTGDDRRAGWLEAMRDAGTVPEADLPALQAIAEDGVTFGAEAMRRLEVAAGAEGVDAVVCTSDSLALGALTVVGTRVPVVGYDNTPVAASLGYSSVEQPLEEVAGGVLELLTGVHGGRVTAGSDLSDPRHRLVAPRLVVRDGPALIAPR